MNVVISCICCIAHVIMETVSYTKLLLEDFSLHYWPLTPSVTRTLEKGWKHLYLLLTLDFIWSHLMITPLNVAFWRAVWTHSNLYLDVTLCKGDLVLANTIAISMTSLTLLPPESNRERIAFGPLHISVLFLSLKKKLVFLKKKNSSQKK